MLHNNVYMANYKAKKVGQNKVRGPETRGHIIYRYGTIIYQIIWSQGQVHPI